MTSKVYSTPSYTLHYPTLPCTALHYFMLHYTSQHCTELPYTALYFTALHYTTLHYTTLHYTTLHYTTIHCIKIRYPVLFYTPHCTTSRYTTYTFYTTPCMLHCTGLRQQYATFCNASFWFLFVNTLAKDATDAFEAANHPHESREMMQAFCVGIYMEVFFLRNFTFYIFLHFITLCRFVHA